jgi:hypothetical protein
MNVNTLCIVDPTLAEIKLNEQRRQVELRRVVLPGAVTLLRQQTEPSVRKYYIRESVPHTDKALLEYCGYNEYLGGRVERDRGGEICVVRYTS